MLRKTFLKDNDKIIPSKQVNELHLIAEYSIERVCLKDIDDYLKQKGDDGLLVLAAFCKSQTKK